MLIAKREVFDDYCDFLFSVLERTEELALPKGAERADRFAGYLGENLTTIYFRKNKDKFEAVEKLYNQYGVVAVFFSAFTPIPYKVFTIASGVGMYWITSNIFTIVQNLIVERKKVK